MSNRATIERKAFITIKPENPTDLSEIEYGYVIYDDYAQEYGTDLMLEDMKLSDIEFLNLLNTILGEVGESILESAIENKGGIYMNDKWYEIELKDDGECAKIVFKNPEPELPKVTELSVFRLDNF